MYQNEMRTGIHLRRFRVTPYEGATFAKTKVPTIHERMFVNVRALVTMTTSKKQKILTNGGLFFELLAKLRHGLRQFDFQTVYRHHCILPRFTSDRARNRR